MKPSAVFLDTSIFAGQGYNFSAAAFASFVPLAKARKISLLLPDATEREIRRHIRVRAGEAVIALQEARRKAPFLAKWTYFPKSPSSPRHTWEATQVGIREWQAFLTQFDVIRLGYEGIKIERVMDWYDHCEAPFGEGKKRKEFPDAFAVAALDIYAQKVPGRCIAIVSADTDFKAACARYLSLMYFQNLPRLTELLLADDADIVGIRAIIDEGLNSLTEEIDGVVSCMRFYPSDRKYEISRTKFAGSQIEDLNIVAVGDGECTVTFECMVQTEHNMTWMDWGYRGASEEPEPWQRDAWVTQRTSISGTAKVAIDRGKRAINEIVWLELDSDEIEIIETPRRY